LAPQWSCLGGRCVGRARSIVPRVTASPGAAVVVAGSLWWCSVESLHGVSTPGAAPAAVAAAAAARTPKSNPRPGLVIRLNDNFRIRLSFNCPPAVVEATQGVTECIAAMSARTREFRHDSVNL